MTYKGVSVYDAVVLGDRFWSKTTRRAGGCVEWTGAINSRGLPLFRIGKAVVTAYRAAVADFYGCSLQDLRGTVILHACDNPWCVNPAHLTVGTQEENMRDMVAKGRARNGTTGPNADNAERRERLAQRRRVGYAMERNWWRREFDRQDAEVRAIATEGRHAAR